MTPGGTTIPEGEPPREENVREADRGWQAEWLDEDRWWQTEWNPRSWTAWKSWKGWENEEQKPAVEQVESGGAGGKVELLELVYDHSLLTLGDWIAQVGPQMSDLSQGAAEWWAGTVGQAKQLYEKDLLNDDVYGYLLALAKSGAVVSVIGGPPCRTVSACRSKSPGPRPVRSEEHPYGFPDLTNSEREMVEGDSILWLRMMTVYLVAEETARRRNLPAVAYGQEQPRDPGDYRVDIPRENLVSVWRFRAWRAFAERYKMEMIHLDQGPLGHERRKPTTIATNLEQLRGLGEVAGPGQGGEAWSENLQERIAQTKRWSAWQAFKEALRSHEEGQVRALRPLSAAAKEQWKRHFECDHQPARRDCHTCVESQGRGRPHHRIQHPQAYTLAVDLSGRLAAGKDQRCQAKYFLATVYTYPTDGQGRVRRWISICWKRKKREKGCQKRRPRKRSRPVTSGKRRLRRRRTWRSRT